MNSNVISVALGSSMILIGCLIAFISQKYYFSTYRSKVKNTVKKQNS